MSTSTNLSKRMSYLLRHEPAAAGLTLDEEGWVDLSLLAAAVGASEATIQEICSEDGKQRFTLSEGRIRAAQGHSFPVKVPFAVETTVPSVLLHGTVASAAEIIRETGLKPMTRQYVHLSESLEIATQVAKRRKGEVVILRVDTQKARSQGVEFSVSENKVWLSSFIPADCIS